MSQIDMSVSQLQSSVKIPYPEPIDLKLPNPFTQRPIATKWSSNELILTDPLMRVASRSSILDIGLKDGSKYISPQHLELGWVWHN